MCFYQAGWSRACCEVIWSEGYNYTTIISQCSITSRLVFSLHTHLMPNFSASWGLCKPCVPSLPALHVDFPMSHLALLPLRWVSVMECVLVVAFSFPSLSLPLCMGTLGLRQSCVAMAAGYVAELCTPGIWSLSLSPYLHSLFSSIYSTFLSGFLRCSRSYQHPSLPLFFSHSHQPITLKSTLTYAMRHIYLKTKCMSVAVPVPLSLLSSFHHLISLSLYSIPTSLPCGGSNTALRDTTVPRVPWHTSLSPVYFETQQCCSLDYTSNSHHLI